MRLDAFQGLWHLERTLEDLRTGSTGRLLGRARFTPAPEGLDYFEDGELCLPGAPPLAASRRYRWRAFGPEAIEVRFADGRLFHRFLADDPAPAAVHDCPPDQYRVRYDFGRWPRWSAEWRVRGPRKAFSILSTFRPAGQ